VGEVFSRGAFWIRFIVLTVVWLPMLFILLFSGMKPGDDYQLIFLFLYKVVFFLQGALAEEIVEMTMGASYEARNAKLTLMYTTAFFEAFFVAYFWTWLKIKKKVKSS